MHPKIGKSSWPLLPLSTIAEEVRELYEPVIGENFPYIGLEHIEQGSLALCGTGLSSETQSTKKMFRAGDILFGTLRPYFRKVVRAKFDGVCSTDITVIRAIENMDRDFLFYFIANHPFIQYATSSSSGTRMPRAKWSHLSTIEWNVPTAGDRKKIAAIVSTYDNLIENNLRRIKILEEMAQTLYREWFVKFRFPGHQMVKMVDSPLGKIPEGWEVTTLNDVLATLESGLRPKGGIDPEARGVPSIGAENIIGLGRYDYSKEKFVTREFFGNMNRGHIQSGDVLLYKDGAQIGRKSMFRDGFPHAECCINEHVFIMRTNERCNQNYLFFWLDQPEMTQNIINLNANAAQPGINQSGVRGLPILLPPAPLLEKAEQILEPMLGALFSCAKRNNILRQTRDLLLPKLISGELDVSELDINVPEANA